MGQPAHVLTAHVGKPQLWAWGALTNLTSAFYGPHNQRIFMAVKVIFLFLTTPFFFLANNYWSSPLRTFCTGILRLRQRTYWRPLPNFKEHPFLWNRYYRETPAIALFKDGDQLVTQGGFTERRPRDNFVWGQVRMLNVGGLTIFLVRGLPLFGPLATPLRQQRLNPRSLRLAWHGVVSKYLTNVTPPTILQASSKLPALCRRPLFWL